MNTRTRTIASFFSVAMAAMLLGAVVTTQIQARDRAGPPRRAARPPPPRRVAPGRPVTLDTFRDDRAPADARAW